MPSPKSNRVWLASLGVVLLWAGAVLGTPPVAAELSGGLLAVHSDRSTKAFTLEPLVGLHLRPGESTHPRLRPEERIRWSGFINVPSKGKYQFDVLLRGRLTVRLAGKSILDARPEGAQPAARHATVELAEGVQTFEAEFVRAPGVARLELFWQGPGFRREPLPFDVLGHLPKKAPDALERDRQVDWGRILVEEFSCVRCHLPGDSGTISKSIRSRSGPDLTKVGQRAFPGYLESWLASPSKWRPGTAMPEMFAPAEKAECHAVARYLSNLGGPAPTQANKPAKDARASARRGEELFTRRGCLACHGRVAGASRSANKLPEEKKSRGGLYQPARQTALAGMGSKSTAHQIALYLRNPLALNEHGRMPNMMLSAKESDDLAEFLVLSRMAGVGPTLPVEPAASERLSAFKRLESRADEVKSFQKLSARDQWLELGKRLVLEKGCNSCHTIEPDGKPFATVLPGIDLEDLAKPEKQSLGCLAEKPEKTSRSPRYVLTKEQRVSVTTFLRHGLQGAGSPAPMYLARLDLQRFNCLACHTRDGEGGLSAGAVKELLRLEKAEHPESVVPPTLSGVGHKLRPAWLKEMLVGTDRARPWMGLRMPGFGAKNIGKLDSGLAALEGADVEDKTHEVKLDAKGLAAGQALVEKSGFGCISCHDLAGVENSGARGPDLASMNKRVRYEWYRRWLEQPQRVSPATRMPTVFPEGKTLLNKVLGGKPDAQAEAMWGYLSQVRRKRKP